MTSTWEEQFRPVMETGRSLREGQAIAGQAIIDAIANAGNLIAECPTGTGKSLAISIPMIHAIHRAKEKKIHYKCVISTETITLQTQVCEKDLPELQKIYGGFTFRKLLGRTNYVCFNSAKYAVKGNAKVSYILETLKTRQSDLGDGERSDVERVLHNEIDNDDWELLVGSSKFCSDNQCDKDLCYSTLAREKAMSADIVVVNHALLATDIEMKLSAGGGAFADGLLGTINVLAVDEGHKLEEVLVSQWTKTLTDWELNDLSSAVITGMDTAVNILGTVSKLEYAVSDAMDGLQELLFNIKHFYSLLALNEGTAWDKVESALSMKYVSGNSSAQILRAMEEYEVENPKRLAKAEEVLGKAIKHLDRVKIIAIDENQKGLKELNKAIRCAKDLIETVRIISKALETKNGIVQQYGAFGAVIEGWTRNNGEKGMTLKLTPLDVSHRAKNIWAGVSTNILISATLTDLTDGSFKYVKESVAFPDGPEIKVGTPFDTQTQQLIYLTTAKKKKVEDGQYSFEELIELIEATDGRTLVLFTSRRELDWAAEQILQLKAVGAFPYKVLVQERDVNKAKLAKEFKSDIHSVLLATRSFFTGFDAAGETVSSVVLVKWPLPRYSVECKQQVAHWASRGFHKWYEMRSLTDLQQAIGRLIRSTDCKGIAAILDFRVRDNKSNVYKIAMKGIEALNSPVTDDIKEVKEFLGQ